ncbi:MAG: hypothetical protein NTX45_11870 [Proteobacteria bacterium]|nr:hypothetical protein [Pseudomonadota bacterium]
MTDLASHARRFLWLFILVCSVALADVPATLNYQGTLADNAGQPIKGERTITFSLYKKTPTGDTLFWAEQQTVTLTDGKFSVVLGGNAANAIEPKQFTGETYIGIKVAGDAEMPRQKLTSVAYALQSGGIPRGVIWMWSGNKADIPVGWALCDGSNNTPDLRGKFILGADATRSVNDGCDGQFKCNIGASGGETAHVLTINEMPSHNHNGATGTESAAHTHYDAGHRHGTDAGNSVLGDGIDRWPAKLTPDGNGYTGTGIAPGYANLGTESAQHTHAISSQGGNAAHEIMPPFYALAFIMKL